MFRKLKEFFGTQIDDVTPRDTGPKPLPKLGLKTEVALHQEREEHIKERDRRLGGGNTQHYVNGKLVTPSGEHKG